MKQTKGSFDWHYTRWFGIITVRTIKLWMHLARKCEFSVDFDRSINKEEPTIIAANHQTLLDPPGVFSAMSFRQLLSVSPVKFMTWHKYYNGKFKFPLYSTGCYPSHGEGLTGVEAAVHYAQNGYRSFIFPEGKRTKPDNRGEAYDGISKILKELPEARLLLCHLDWQPRKRLFSRPKVRIIWKEAPSSLDRNNANAIMEAVYQL